MAEVAACCELAKPTWINGMFSRTQYFDFLFRAHRGELFNFVSRRLGTEHAEDLVQDAYLRMLQHQDPQSIENPRAFLYQTSSNLSIDHHRREVIQERIYGPDNDSDATVSITGHTPEQDLAFSQELDQMNAILMELPELTRHAFVLHRLEGMSHKEVAKRLDLSIRDSERRVAAAAQHLLIRLDDLSV